MRRPKSATATWKSSGSAAAAVSQGSSSGDALDLAKLKREGDLLKEMLFNQSLINYYRIL